MMSHEHDAGDLDALRAEIEAAERRVAREIEPGARALVVAILVFVLLGSFILPHTGSVRGWDVLFSSHGAGRAAVALPSRVFAWLALVFGVGFSMLALLTRRWALAGGAGGFGDGQRYRAAGRMVASDGRRRSSRPRYRAHRRLDHRDRVDIPLGPGGVVAHHRAARSRGAASPRRRATTVQDAAGPRANGLEAGTTPDRGTDR